MEDTIYMIVEYDSNKKKMGVYSCYNEAELDSFKKSHTESKRNTILEIIYYPKIFASMLALAPQYNILTGKGY